MIFRYFFLDDTITSNPDHEKERKKALHTRKNPLIQQTGILLFKNRDKTGDITFEVETKQIKAHKCVLAALSPEYYMGQFYGGFNDAKIDVITIPNVSAAAFEEYLQFFYLDEVILTHENIRDVITLTKMALVTEFTNECFNFLLETLSVENVCLSYQLAVIDDRTGLIDCCEHEISMHSDEVFASEGFLICTRGDLFNILQSDSLNCKETDVFEACISWAKNVCTIEGLDPGKMENLRKTLVDGNLLYQIRFGAMTIEEFMKCCYKKYKELFTEDEREEILYMIGKDSNVVPTRFSDEPRDVRYRQWDEKNTVICDRVFAVKPSESFHFGLDKTVFFTDKPVLLGGFCCGSLLQGKASDIQEKCVTFNVSIIRKNTPLDTDGKILRNTTEDIIFKTTENGFVKLQRPIMISPNFVYEIQMTSKVGFSVKNCDFLKEVVVAEKVKKTTVRRDTLFGSVPEDVFEDVPGTRTVVKFPESSGIITRLKLNLCHEIEPCQKIEPLP